MKEYELFFLSQLRRYAKCTEQNQENFQVALSYMFERMDKIANETTSQFNTFIGLIRKWLPNSFLITLLNRMRYDSIIGFKQQQGKKHVFCMISYQKHPSRQMIGMFDIHVNPIDRNQKVAQQFEEMAAMINTMSERYRKNGYIYLQCGNNETTTRVLRIFGRIAKKKYPQLRVDVETSRIFLHPE